MGMCRDFGSRISEGCDHLMRAGSDSCHCEACGVVCNGQFEACPTVWALGPRPDLATPAPADDLRPADAAAPSGTAGDGGTDGRTDDSAGPLPATVAAAGGKPAASIDDPGVEVFRWFQTVFDELHQEVEGLRSALSREQALVATLLASRSADAGIDPESLRDLVGTAISEAVRREMAELGTDLIAAVATLRREFEAVRVSHDAQAADLRAVIGASVAALEYDNAGVQASTAAMEAKLDRLAESETSLASALAEVSESVSGLAADRTEEPAVDPPSPVAHGSRFRVGAIAVRRRTPKGAGPTHRTRVSLRKHPLDG